MTQGLKFAGSHHSIFALILIGVCVALNGCKDPNPKFPVEREITNANGVSLKVRAVGKSRSHLKVVRLADSQKFDISFADLSVADREFFSRYPLTEPMRLEDPPPPPSPPNPPYVKTRLDQISQIEKKVSALKIEVDSRTLSNQMQRHYQDEIVKLEKEARELKAEIDVYNLRHGN